MRSLASYLRKRKYSQLTLSQKVAAILKKLGTNVSLWLPSIGLVNGLQAGNYLDSVGTTAATVDNPVGLVKDANGTINASQGTTASKPILRRGSVNIFTYSNDVTNVAWGSLRATKTSGTLTATATDANGFGITRTLTGQGSLNTFQLKIKKGTSNFALITSYDGVANGVRQWFNLGTGQVASSATFGTGWSKVNATTVPDANGYYLCTFTVSGVAGNLNFTIYPSVPTDGGFSCTLGDVGYINDLMLEIGATASPYIETTSAAASSPTGNYWWQFDGNNDYLALGSVPFQMADSFCIIAAASSNNVAATQAVAALRNATSVNPRISILVNASAINGSWVNDAGTVVNLTSAGFSLANNEVFVASIRKTGNLKQVSKNGVFSASTNNTDLGATTLDTATIGIYSSTTLSSPMFGNGYIQMWIKGAVSDADHLILSKFIGLWCGVYF